MPYVDGFLIPIRKKNVPAYRRVAQAAAKVWRKYGALEYRECVGDDLNTGMGTPFTRAAKAKPGDRVNAKVMKDPHVLRGLQGDRGRLTGWAAPPTVGLAVGVP